MINITKNNKLFFILLIFWMLFTFNFSYLNLIAGTAVCFIITRLSYAILYNKKRYSLKIPRIKVMIKYFFNLMLEIYKSSFSYMIRIIKKDCEPFIVEVELKVKDPLVITIISNSITLTPGTLTVDINDNKLTVLALKNCDDREMVVRTEIKEKFEKIFIKA
ncbi:Na+/H+ antiporter subunit E [Wukongibacter sp. M2B1]|uniref:Na+/H+ antiporter subunit E n=1 Tax=Wukongibacter sp. M2B1 TaxID=3088895 RepID=UPI003D7A4514